jgi:CheY-like chemotaxis protein
MKSPKSQLSGLPRLDGARVLVVDDTASVLQVLRDILEMDGAIVTAVDGAEEALAILQEERPDVLLSDLAMPGRGGYWLIGQVRCRPSGAALRRPPRSRPSAAPNIARACCGRGFSTTSRSPSAFVSSSASWRSWR